MSILTRNVATLMFVLALALVGVMAPIQSAQAAGEISLAALGAPYTQDFDTLASSGQSGAVPAGWAFHETGTNANATYTAGTGSSNTGDTYSFGAAGSSERAFGGLLSGSLTPRFGAGFVNHTGGTITDLTVAYTGEQWRLGAVNRTDRLDFQYSTDAADLNSGTWTQVAALAFNGPISTGTAGALNGNAAANRAAVSFTISGLSIPQGATFWIRWLDFNAASSDDGLAVDDFSLTPLGQTEPAAPKINEFSASTAGTDVEYVEFIGDPNTDYSAYTLLEIEGDFSGTAIGVVDEVLPLGATAANGLYLANLPTNALENGTLTLLLVKNFTGVLGADLDADNNGVPDAAPWEAVVDAVAVHDGGSSDATYGVPVLNVAYDGAPFAPGGASRIPDGFDTDASTDWARNDFDLAGIPGFSGTPVMGEALNTPGAANALVLPPAPKLVINELDYDQPGTDAAEFVELRNNGLAATSLSGWTLELVNGSGGSAAVYNAIPLPDVSLAPGDYFVICANAATVANCDLDASPNTDFLQNGAPDAVGLRYNGELMDAVSYEGDTAAPYTEGAGAGLEDPGTTGSDNLGLSRCPDGADSDVNNADFVLRGITPGAANQCAGADTAPAVTSLFPANGAADFPVNADLTVTFSEPVNLASGWYALSCSSSGGIAAAVSGGPTTFALNPSADLVAGESCTFTVYAAGVSDQDANDPPDAPDADVTITFSALNVCALAYTPTYTIQGSGPSAAVTGAITTQGVVIGDYEGASPALRGFYIQDITGDGDPATSDGLFVFNGNNNSVSLGDVVRVTGTAADYQDQTQVSASAIVKCGVSAATPVDVTFPAPSAAYLEQYEGMLVRLPQTMYVTEHFQLGRFGQVVLSANGRLQQPTNIVAPGAAALALQAANDLSKIILDDATQAQNPDPIVFGRGGLPLSASNTLRGGDTATGIVGILTYTWSGNAASGNAYRIRPVSATSGLPDFQPANPRPAAAPEVGGTVKVVGMNLLNYFNTFSGCSNGVGGAAADCRGAENLAEFERQAAKTVAAILALAPDVIGVNEIENDGYGANSALADLVNRLNAATAAGAYAYVDVDAATGQVNALGVDGIKVGMIYRPAAVTPVGQTAALNSTAFVNAGDSAARNRASLAQAFQAQATGAVFIVNVNHLKSKGSACDAPDAGDGQGNCNLVRVNAVGELMQWLAGDPTGTGDPDVLLVGDYNSYAMEDPIRALEAGGFTHLIKALLGPDAYSYVFDGQWGYLDHALASASLAPQVTGVADFHINADEPSVLDYNTNFKTPGQVLSLYAADAFRVSDHDPVIIGLNPNAPPTVSAGGPYEVYEGQEVAVAAAGSDPNGDALAYAWDLDDDGVFETPGESAAFSAAGLDGPDSALIRVRVTDPGGLSAVAQAVVQVLNANPAVTAEPAAQTVQYSDPLAPVLITAADVAADLPFASSVEWRADGGAFTAGLPAWLSLSPAACDAVACTWTLTGTALAAPGAYAVRLQVSDKDGGAAAAEVTLTVTPEDARAFYTGPLLVATGSTSSSTALVTLAATVQDVSATPGAAGDAWPGDIRNATVTFVDRLTNAAIPNCAGLPVSLVSPGDSQTGAVICNWSVSIGGDAQDFTVGVVVNNYYSAAADDVVVTVFKPLASEFITGGGYITLQGSAGQLAGDDGSRANFGFNVKYHRNGKNLKGNFTLLVRRLEGDGVVHVYQIKGNVMSSLAVQSETGAATFTGKAQIRDVTNPAAAAVIDGNAALQVVMVDNGEPGASDTIGITLWHKDGGLWFASRWDGAQTVQQALDGGNLSVR